MDTEEFNQQKLDLIDIVIWYRDNYHSAFGRKNDDDLITQIKACTTESELNSFEVIVDGWISY